MIDISLSGKKIAVILESKYIPEEIECYRKRFAEFGAVVHYLSRIFYGDYRPGHPYWKIPVFYSDVDPSDTNPLKPPELLSFTLDESSSSATLPLLKDVSEVNGGDYAAIIMAANYTSVRLRYFEAADAHVTEETAEESTGNDNQLSEKEVLQLIRKWYEGTNEHIPVEELESLLSDDVKMSYPDTPDLLEGKQAFRKWYANALTNYFDETHVIEKIATRIADNAAIVHVLVRWETRKWEMTKSRSTYRAYLSDQHFLIHKNEKGQLLITEKHALTFEETAPQYGPFQKEDPAHSVKKAQVVRFFEKIMEDKKIVKGALCHGLWILTPNPYLLKNRKVICHPVVMADIINCGAQIVHNDLKVVADNDLVTGFSAKEAEPFVCVIKHQIDLLNS